MPNVKPWLTTDDLVEAVKLTMSFPLSQNSFTYNNIVTFLNQELQLNAVPTLLEEHQEYLVYKTAIPLVSNISRYPIPDRSIGMTLRDVKFADQSGNYYDITRIAPDDKAFFQQSNGSNQTVGKFYLEGNEMVLTPQLLSNPTGYLIQFFHLRPNYLVRNERAAIIKHFHKRIEIIDNTLIVPGDEIEVMIGNQSPSPTSFILTAVNSNAQTISNIGFDGKITTNFVHGFPLNSFLNISLSGVSGTTLNINNSLIGVISTGTNTLQIEDSNINVVSPTYTFTVTSANATAGAIYENNGNYFTVVNTITGSTTLVTNGIQNPLLTGTLTKISGDGDSTIAFSSYSLLTYNGYIFTVASANATSGAVYQNGNGELFTVLNTITGSTQLSTSGTISTESTGTLTRVSGTGDLTISFASFLPVINTGGSYSISNQFVVGASAATTASNAVAVTNAAGVSGLTAVVVDATDIEFQYSDISDTFYISNSSAFSVDNVHLEIQFDQLDATYTDPDTDITTPLYVDGCLVDFLQTKPGHRTYTYDVELVDATGVRGKFPVAQLQNYMSNSNGGVLEFYPIKVGDYICLQNECIIPQIPPELHHALAERAASRVLMAIGDKEGYAASMSKIQEMDRKQQTLIGSRVESSVPKVFNRYSLLRLGKSRFRRRY